MNQQNTTHQELWHSCLMQVQKCTSQDEFDNLFQPLRALSFSQEGVLRLMVPNEGSARRIEQNYIKLLIPIIRNVFGSTATISYVFPRTQQNVSSTNNGSPAQIYSSSNQGQSISNPFISPTVKKVNFDSQLRPEYTFDNFVEGECNLLVRSAGVSITENPGGNNVFNPLFIYGGSGMGKTHLVQAIGNGIAKKYPDHRILYVSANRFQSQFQYAAQHSQLADFIQFYQMIDVLIIDDIQEFAGKPGTQNIFFNIFNHLHMLGKQLIMTSDRPPVELKDIEDRLITRFKWGLTAEINVPDRKTKISIIKQRSRVLGINISEDVVNFIATNINSSVRELEGTITSLHAQSRLLGKSLNIGLVRSVLRDIVTVESSEITTDKILETVSQYFKVDISTLLSAKRTRLVATARQIAMYLSKVHTHLSLSSIGDAFGGKNHATVHHACKTLVNLMETDKNLRIQIEEIQKKLHY